ncbi:hypothetical protein CAPTEDRAFT_168572 [Capitella teleta]|uniref:RING-type domain-containing protein n=1 Tax=Capitella teleta TaxID=283909 RepID=R7T3N3_CAPTE|nr:hypothetical protein CAPTEDRAFT_168572 [Capitella teleta]|eukprot:ELT87328.1 hypothetical protein CAPTEDRAFT_168572 [Capitella teleta]
MNSSETQQNPEESMEPSPKKMKIDNPPATSEYKLEERLSGILCCAVCLDLPKVAVYQCTNGHLMCAGCLAHLLADARLKDEEATCPNCRCDISKNLCTRNLAVEKAISEMPAPCPFCATLLPRAGLNYHTKAECQERLVQCQYQRIGCSWEGPFHESSEHEAACALPKRSGREVLSAITSMDAEQGAEIKRYHRLFDLLSYEKITFNDLQLRPYRTDDFITKLYYETSRFSAFNMQWVIKSHVNDSQKSPEKTCKRTLSYQLILKSKIEHPFHVHFLALRGPYGDMQARPAVYEFEFTKESLESPVRDLPVDGSSECNRLLALKNINMRLILFQVPKKQ